MNYIVLTKSRLDPDPDNADVKIISWNVKGMNQAIKRKRVISHLQHLGVGIAFLQETHLRNCDQSKIRKEWVGQMFHSQFNCKG